MSDASSSTRLYLVRHQATAESSLGRCCGRTDVPLSDAGRERASRLSAAFAEFQLAGIYSSPLRRATATAEPIAAAANREIVLLDGLAEIDFGIFEGLAFTEIATRYPELYQAWMTDPTSVQFPGGESYADLKARVTAATDEIVLRHRGSNLVAVTHAGPIRAVLGSVLEIPDQRVFRLDVPHGSVSLVEWLGDEPVVRSLAMTGEGT